MKFLKEGFGRMFDFSGRTNRKDFWKFYFASIVFCAIVSEIGKQYVQIEIIYLILACIFFFPLFSIQVRRLHDSGRSGQFLFFLLIPYIGQLILLIIYCLSDPYENKYGLHPDYSGGNQTKKYKDLKEEDIKVEDFKFRSSTVNDNFKNNSFKTDERFSNMNKNNFCTNCGKPVISESLFCGKCGTKY